MNTTQLFSLPADAYEVPPATTPAHTRTKFGRFLDRQNVSVEHLALVVAFEDRFVPGVTRMLRSWADGTGKPANILEMWLAAEAIAQLRVCRVHPSRLFDEVDYPSTIEEAEKLQGQRANLRHNIFTRTVVLAIKNRLPLREVGA